VQAHTGCEKPMPWFRFYEINESLLVSLVELISYGRRHLLIYLYAANLFDSDRKQPSRNHRRGSPFLCLAFFPSI
jgi:hypothetical protein